MLKTIRQNTSAEIVEKKSKFIANVYYITSEEEAEEKIKEIKKRYHDAKHHCYAYSIMTENGIKNKMSDDGEPSGTAGIPMLNLLQKRELVNVLVIVTRYFGGILLGTGGLFRAYSEATMQAMEKAEVVKEEEGYEVEVMIDYQELEKLQYHCQKMGLAITQIEYEEKVKCMVEMTEQEKKIIEQQKEEKLLKIEKIKILKKKNIRKNIEK